MDNLTHTLAGLLLAEAAVEIQPRRDATFRTAAFVASIFVNNAPDLDFVYARITEPPLGYLLHHRGHSHTVPVAFALGLLTTAAFTIFARQRGLAWSRTEYRTLSLLCCAGPLVHLAMDFSNNYGVHPFWPAYSGWFYGDAVFIVEPFFWAAAIPPLIFAARTRVARFTLATVLALGLALCWGLTSAKVVGTDLIPVPMAASVTLLAFGATLLARATGPRARIALAVGVSWAIALVFGIVSFAARAALLRSPPLAGAKIHDIVVTPMPANPLCAAALVVETEGDAYVVKRATVATMPGWLPSDSCPVAMDGEPTAPLSPVAASSSREISWKGEFRAPLVELFDLAHRNCQAAAFLKFARVPYWVRTGTNELVIGDLRFDRQPGLDFSDLRIAGRPLVCPAGIPPWLPPRHDLLAGDR